MSEPETPNDRPPQGSEKFQFSLRGMFVLTTVCAVAAALCTALPVPGGFRLAAALYLMVAAAYAVLRLPYTRRKLQRLRARRQEIHERRQRLLRSAAKRMRNDQ